MIAFVLFLIGAEMFVYFQNAPKRHQIACTMEAKQCPDGSYVGRSGSNCEFAECPASTLPPLSLDCKGPSDYCPSGYTCIQKCGPPVVRVGDPPPGYYCALNEIVGKPRMCPI